MSHPRRWPALLIGLALLSGAARGGAAEAPQVLLAESEHDFGEVWEGEPLSHDFAFHNAGGAPLRAKGG
jgi:hypothetical protein